MMLKKGEIEKKLSFDKKSDPAHILKPQLEKLHKNA